MDDSGVDGKLLKGGFTQKEIKFIRTRAENEKISTEEVVKQLNRVFISLSVGVVALILLGVWGFFCSENFNVYIYMAIFIFVLAAIFLCAPIRLGTKVFIYLIKQND